MAKNETRHDAAVDRPLSPIEAAHSALTMSEDLCHHLIQFLDEVFGPEDDRMESSVGPSPDGLLPNLGDHAQRTRMRVAKACDRIQSTRGGLGL